MTRLFTGVSSAIKSLFRSPSYYVVSVAVLGISIAAQLTIFAMVRAFLFEPPSARSPESLVFIKSSLDNGIVSYPDFIDVAERSKSFSEVFGYLISSRSSLNVGDDFRTAICGVVSGSYFPTLDYPAARGRLIEPGDDREKAAPIAVISDELARSENLSLGSLIKINTHPFTVVGILPANYRGIERTVAMDLWIPAAQVATVGPSWILTNRGSQSIKMGGRLAPGVTLETANAELEVIAQQLQKENPTKNYGMTLRAGSFAGIRYSLDSTARMTVLLSALVWLLFALSVTNFFALTLLRLLNRERESAVRMALGATQGDLSIALLADQFIVAVSALGFGLLVSWAVFRLLRLDPRIARMIDTAGVALDSTALVTVGLAMGLCAIVVWALTVRQSRRGDLLGAIKAGSTAPRRMRSFNILFAAQFALSLMLATSAVALLSSLRHIANERFNFRTDNLLLFDVSFRNLGVSNDDRVIAAEKFLAPLRSTPGVESVGAAPYSPLSGAGWTNLVVNEKNPSLEADKGFAYVSVVAGDFFSAAGFKFVQGRAIEPQEVLSGNKVTVINAATAKRYWPGENALGKALRPWDGGALYTVVGVIADTPVDASLRIRPQIYIPWGQMSTTTLTFYVAVDRDNITTRQAIQNALTGVWPYKTLPPIRSAREQIGNALSDLSLSVRVVIWIAGFATLVTACGLYFFSAYAAAQSLKDSAIRQALGAERKHLIAAHLSRYYAALGVGTVIGIGLLYEVQPMLEKLGVPIPPLKFGDVATSLGAMGAVALFGLCVPLGRVLRANILQVLNRGQ